MANNCFDYRPGTHCWFCEHFLPPTQGPSSLGKSSATLPTSRRQIEGKPQNAQAGSRDFQSSVLEEKNVKLRTQIATERGKQRMSLLYGCTLVHELAPSIPFKGCSQPTFNQQRLKACKLRSSYRPEKSTNSSAWVVERAKQPDYLAGFITSSGVVITPEGKTNISQQAAHQQERLLQDLVLKV